MQKTRVRIHFSKTGDLRWISHRDLARVWERLLRRAGLKLAFSEGFHPKPKISFPSALALGIVAMEEIVEMDLVGSVDLQEAREHILAQLPEGMQMLQFVEIPSGAKARMVAATYEIELKPDDSATVAAQLQQLTQAGQVLVTRDDKTLQASFNDPWFEIVCQGNVLRFTLPTTAQGSLRPSEVLAALGVPHALPDGAVLTRTRVHLAAESAGTIASTAEANASLLETNEHR